MLMLQGHEVESAELVIQSGNQLQKVKGVSYKQRLFTPYGAFPKADKQQAIEACRQLFTQKGDTHMVLFVENQDEFVLWLENHHVKVASLGKKSVADLSLKTVVAKMRTVNGIKIKDRQYHLKTYPSCFLGNEAVRWFMHELKLNHDEAIELGQRLIDEKWFHHVQDAHQFKDEQLFYRFYWDEE